MSEDNPSVSRNKPAVDVVAAERLQQEKTLREHSERLNSAHNPGGHPQRATLAGVVPTYAAHATPDGSVLVPLPPKSTTVELAERIVAGLIYKHDGVVRDLADEYLMLMRRVDELTAQLTARVKTPT